MQTGKVRLVCLALAIILVLGLWASGPYLLAEHSRLELWKIFGLWAGDVMGLLWFARFAFDHAILSDPLAAVPPNDGRRSLKLVAWAGAAALLVDLCFTLYLMACEREGYLHGRVAEAQVFAVQEHKRELATSYDLDCTFTDQAGVRHRAHLRVYAVHHEMPSALPVAAGRALTSQAKEPFPIRIRYDPTFPARAWIDGLGWHDGNGIYWFSIGALLLQAAVTGLFLLLLSRYSASGEWPWWWDIYKVLPLAAETACMIGIGLIDRVMDSLT